MRKLALRSVENLSVDGEVAAAMHGGDGSGAPRQRVVGSEPRVLLFSAAAKAAFYIHVNHNISLFLSALSLSIYKRDFPCTATTNN